MRGVTRFAVTIALLILASPAHAATGGYHSPGYAGLAKIPDVKAQPLPAVTLGTGKDPRVLVDAAGTGHIVFSGDGGASAADTVSYCRLLRGHKTCAATSTLMPNAPPGGQSGPFEGNIPSGNHDFDGAVPLANGDQLLLADRRFPDAFAQPDGQTGESNVFLWTSFDGGQSFTGPGIIGDNEMGGGATLYGGANPQIGTLSRTQTGGTTFQGDGAGQFTRAKALLGDAANAYDGTVATDGTLPVVAFDSTANLTTVREWSGSGDVNNPATWSTASFAGSSPRIAAGASGVFVLYRDALTGGNVLVRRIVGGQPTGTPIKLSGPAGDATLAEDSAGQLEAGWIDQAGVELRSSRDGTTWTPPQLVGTPPPGGSLGNLALAATADGGGFATYVQNPQGAEGLGTVVASVFGTQQGTGLPGINALPGGGIGTPAGDQLATESCTTLTFGAVTARTNAGCFIRDQASPTASLDISLGPVDLNGLLIIPDDGVKIAINPREHSIDTSGKVAVVLRAPGIGDITLWHDAIHIKVSGAADTDLFDFPSLTAPKIEGFPIDGSIDVKLVKDGVKIPVSLTLPSYFGGITGSATLLANLQQGFVLDSLEIKIGDAILGALELKDVDISYARTGEKWLGKATVQVPAGGAAFNGDFSVEFDNGAFSSGAVVFNLLPFPGIPIDPDQPPALYLYRGGMGLGLSPLSLSGTLEFGAIPLDPPNFTYKLDGTIAFALGNPPSVTLTGTGYLRNIKIEVGKLVYSFPDTVSITGSEGYDLGVLKEEGQLSAIIDPAHKLYGGMIKGDTVIDLQKLGVSPTAGVLDDGKVTIPSGAFAINSTGFGACLPVIGGVPLPLKVTYRWGNATPDVIPTLNCDLSEFTAGLPQVRAGTRAAGSYGFTVPGGATSVAVKVLGAGGSPDVVLTAPNGSQVVPTTTLSAQAPAIAIGNAEGSDTMIGLQHPAAGRWVIAQAPGSAITVTGVQSAAGEAATAVKARVGGHGAARTLRYTVRAPKNVTVSFAEQAGGLFHVLGSAKHAVGTLRFGPARGPAGNRSIVALIDENGLPSTRPVVATYVAPAPARPGRVAGLHVRAGGRAFTVSFVPPTGASRTLVTVAASDGRHLQLVLQPHARTTQVPVIGYADAVRVTVRGVSPTGARGPIARAGASRRQARPRIG